MTKTVLITGASGGIGIELCKEFLRAGYTLVCVDKEIGKLEEYQIEFFNGKPNLYIIEQDLRQSNAHQRLYSIVKKLNLEIDILLNVAGFGIYGDFLEQSIEDNEDLINVNVRGLMKLCYIFGKDMRKRGSGYIVNFSSISAFFPGKLMSSYYASKVFVLSFSIALAEELKKDNIKVLAICPDVIDTSFYVKAKADKTHSYLLTRMPPKRARSFAKKAFKAIQKGKKYYVVIGLRAKIIAFFSLFLPKRFQVKIIGFIQAKTHKNKN